MINPLSGLRFGLSKYCYQPRDLGYSQSKFRLYLHAYLLSLIEANLIEVTQDGQKWANNKLVASLK